MKHILLIDIHRTISAQNLLSCNIIIEITVIFCIVLLVLFFSEVKQYGFKCKQFLHSLIIKH
jgi:hypothetical protein